MTSGLLKSLILVVDYYTKRMEVEVVARTTVERVRQFYWRNIICRFGVPGVIVSDNEAQFASTSVFEFSKDLGIQNRFISVEYPQANGQTEASNKIIMSGMKKKMDWAKGLWIEYLHEFLWSYHTTPHLTTWETPFRMVYGVDAMIPVEINTPI